MANFEVATREKYRFPFRGSITVEDLWDLNAEQLDTVFKTLNKEKCNTDEESLIDTNRSKENDALSNRIEIVKHIFEVKQAEALARREEAQRSAQKQRIMRILADKEDEVLKNLSIEELRNLLDKG